MRALATRRLQDDPATAEQFLAPQDSDAGAEAWEPGGEDLAESEGAPADLSSS